MFIQILCFRVMSQDHESRMYPGHKSPEHHQKPSHISNPQYAVSDYEACMHK